MVGTVLVLVVAGLCLRLGFWQLERRAQRATLNSAIEQRMSEAPADISRVPRDTAGLLYRRVRIAGVPDASRAIVLPGRLYRGAPGAHVLVPVPLAGGDAVLVDFGWAPAADAATVALDSMRLDRPMDGTAIVLPFPGDEPGARQPAPNLSRADTGFRRVWFAMDAVALRTQFPYDLGSVHLQLLPAEGAPRLPVRQPAPALDPGPHLGYAIQWFSFAAIAIIGWLVIFNRSAAARPGVGSESDS